MELTDSILETARILRERLGHTTEATLPAALAAMGIEGQLQSALKTPLKGGKCLYHFSDHTVITKAGATSAGVTMSTVSGVNGIAYDNSGSRTGSPKMVKLSGDGTVTGSTTYTIPAAQLTPTNVNGKVGLWLYCDPANPTGPSLNVSWSINATITGELNTFWNTNQIRPGWNFLVFDQKQATHPFGLGVSYGSADLVANDLKCFRLEFSSMAGDIFYLDTLWHDFDQTPQIVLGWDSADADVLANALPAMQERGWVGYIAEPCFVWTTGSTYYDDFSTKGARTARIDAFQNAGWDVCNHTTSHRSIGTLGNDDVRYEIANARGWALSHNWKRGAEFYVSPQSSTSVAAEAIIASLGIKAQRHAKHRNVHRTPFGVDNLSSIGSFDMGNQTFAAIKAVIDANISYRADTFLFAHNIVAGGAADGSTVPGVSTQMYKTTLLLVLDYIKSLELAGACEVAKGFSGWYYGAKS